MRIGVLLVVAGVAGAAQDAGGDGVAHMRHVRPVLLDAPASQAYLVVDEETWTRARRDLADLRLRTQSGRPVPYVRLTRGAAGGLQEVRARILQPGRIAGRTRFLIEIPESVREYDRVRLELRSRDFVAAARVEGADTDSPGSWVDLGEHSLFDFTRERLGSSTILQLPPTRFRYLRVSVPAGIGPADVQAAHVPGTRRQDAQWLDLQPAPHRREQGTTTRFVWDHPERVPLEGVRFEVAPGQQNFVRRVEVGDGQRVFATGTIRRVHRMHGGHLAHTEELDLAVPAAHSDRFEVIVHNADDPPLAIARVVPRAQERRLYFEPGSEMSLQLFFGDEDARAPEYEYARLFAEDAGARPARLGPVADNPAFMPRPDLRPWSERHPAILWTALAGAVLVLGFLAVRALRHGEPAA